MIPPAERGTKIPIEAIKAELKTLCAAVPLANWESLAGFHNSKDIPIGMKLESPLLP